MPIRDIRAEDETVWRTLWAQYITFYQAEVSAAVTDTTWSRLIGPDPTIFCLVAEDESGAVVGFANAVLHPATWTVQSVCYLEDLFVDPAARRQGVGHALIEALLARGRTAGWARLYWHTDAVNDTARRLYDRFTPADPFVRYRIFL